MVRSTAAKCAALQGTRPNPAPFQVERRWLHKRLAQRNGHKAVNGRHQLVRPTHPGRSQAGGILGSCSGLVTLMRTRCGCESATSTAYWMAIDTLRHRTVS